MRQLSRKPAPISHTCIVIPAHNEAENIPHLLAHIDRMRKPLRSTISVLVVDDASTDDTAAAVIKEQKKRKDIHLLRRTPAEREAYRGLGAVYVTGFTHAMKTGTYDALIEMDADLSHDPDRVPEMIEKLSQGYDFVIGSRYVQGGSIPSDWGFKRVMLSKGANLYTRTILGLKIKDCSGGYRAIRTSLLKNIDLDTLPTRGYAFQAAILYASVKRGASITEIPIHFKDRERGVSKMRLKDILEWGTSMIKLRLTWK